MGALLQIRVVASVICALFLTIPSCLGGGDLSHAEAQARIFKAFAVGFEENPATFSTWSTDDPCDGSWVGIICDGNGTVTILDLNGNGLNGTLPAVVGEMVGLEQLFLYNNHLKGLIPPELGNLKKTTIIWLFNNDLEGEIPEELGNLTSCLQLHMYNNKLTGSVPASLSVIDSLRLRPGNNLCATIPGVPCSTPPPPAAVPISSPPPPSPAPPPILGLEPPIQGTPSGPAYPPWTGGLSPSPPPEDTPAPWALPHLSPPSLPPPVLSPPSTGPLSCSPCTSGLTHGIETPCNCVNATTLQLRFTALQLWSYTDAVEADLLDNLAGKLDVKTIQLRVTGRRAGSVILDINVLPLTGPSLSTEAVNSISTNLQNSSQSMPPQYIYEVIDGPRVPVAVSDAGGAQIGVIIGSVAGGIGLIIFIIVGYLCLRLNKSKNGEKVVVAGKNPTERTWSKTPLRKQIVYGSMWNRKAATSASEQTPLPPVPEGAITDSGVKRLEEGDKRDNDTHLPKRVLSFDLGGSKKEKAETVKVEEPAVPRRVDALSLRAVQNATKDFSKTRLLGDGAYGRIYKAHFTPGEVATVVALSGEKIETGDFLEQVKVLGTLDSRHFVPLIGYSGERGQRLLIYDFMPNGSLLDHLHGELRFGRQLNWHKRVRIARDVAEALTYLHGAADPPMIQRDLRAANVMLDANFRAKIGEYGLASLVKAATSKAVSPTVLGSIAYQAPEFRSSGIVTVKSDVFSFGVIMLEIFTGRKPFDTTRPKRQQSLLNWVLPQIESRRALQSMVDPYLRLNSSLDPRSLQKFALLAGRCLQHNPNERPSMATVLQELQQLIKEDSSTENSESLDEQGDARGCNKEGLDRDFHEIEEEWSAADSMHMSENVETASLATPTPAAARTPRTPPPSVEDWDYIRQLSRQFPPGLDGWAEVRKSTQSIPDVDFRQ